MKLELQKGSRSRVLMVGLFVVVAIFVVRLFELQVVKHNYYAALADQEQRKSLTIPAKRGLIYGMDGNTPVPLVMNQTVYTVFADPQVVSDDAAVLSELRAIAGGNMVQGAEELLASKKSRYQIMATRLTYEQAERLRSKKLAGIGFHEESQRVYPEGDLAGQILGFVNAEGKGNYGVEAALNNELKGVDGQLNTVTDVRDVPLTIGDSNINIPATNGKNIVLTIDRNVQNKAEQALKAGLEKIGATNGSVVVMNPKNGRILAMANYPSYNPAEYFKVKNAADFNNATISTPYEPASVVKTFALAAGIDRGVITPGSTYYNTDKIKVDDRTIENAFKGVTGTINMQDVLNNSLNTGTVTVAQRLGGGDVINRQARDIMYDYYHNRFGLGEFTGVELANESAGIIVPPGDVQGNAVRYANMTFGQGMDVTMVQVSAAFSSVINGGHYYQPTVIAGTLEDEFVKAETKPAVRSTVSPSTSEQMRDMLVKARQSVAYMRDADLKGYEIGGKTGTSETLLNGKYIKNQTIGSYLGFGGANSPEYAIMVQVSAPNRNLEGGLHASPIFTDISNWMIEYLRIAPKG